MKRTTLFLFAISAMAIFNACAANTDKADTDKKEDTLNSGLRVVDLTPGQGDAAQPGDTVQVNYTGWLYEDGKRTTQFDSSIGGAPFDMTIGVTGVIRGWTEGLVGMKVGGKRQLIIPPDLGYGARGAGGVIPPGATLEFEIELLQLQKGK